MKLNMMVNNENEVQRIMQVYNLGTIIEYMKGAYHYSKKTLQIMQFLILYIGLFILYTSSFFGMLRNLHRFTLSP